ncbi:PH domain-containing protein [Actinomadura barringtoniae]|uniref:PH domain-containing protein n=1 Tax=Actinomadura barringtoniae TaxID=1427535 RepID=A0A939PIW8_9ACTN|nr:PH domain-containing protein [Actinomadura barringtoniae]MBO2450903.1 PH domain-containing protein [Actinomadura barringtoniae]
MERRTVRCYRYLLVMTALVVFLGVVIGLLVRALVQGLSYLEALGAVILLAVLGLGLVMAVAALRSRVIVDAKGVTIVGALRRWRYAWEDVTEISLHASLRYWEVYLRTADAERRVFFYPVGVFAPAAGGERFSTPPPHTPPGLATLYARLTELRG